MEADIDTVEEDIEVDINTVGEDIKVDVDTVGEDIEVDIDTVETDIGKYRYSSRRCRSSRGRYRNIYRYSRRHGYI